MKCLTIYQPWASLIVLGAKTHETRTWKTQHRGPLLIHAGRRFLDAARDITALEPFHTPLREAGYPMASDLPLGAIVGMVELIDCKDVEEIRDGLSQTERDFGDFRNGRWAWILGSPVKFSQPVIYQGKQGIFDIDDRLLESIIKEAKGATLASLNVQVNTPVAECNTV